MKTTSKLKTTSAMITSKKKMTSKMKTNSKMKTTSKMRTPSKMKKTSKIETTSKMKMTSKMSKSKGHNMCEWVSVCHKKTMQHKARRQPCRNSSHVISNSTTLIHHMVENNEDAYWLKSLSLFTVECDHYWDQKNKKFGENWLIATFIIQTLNYFLSYKGLETWHFMTFL